jgi:hypothetical protein
MTEKEIIQYLKDNRIKGVAFGFMPEDVRIWCHNNRKSLLIGSIRGTWESVFKQSESLNKFVIVCLPEDFRLEVETEIEYEDFDIDEDGYFTVDGFHYLWCCWQDFLMEYSPRYINFGGWQYDGCDDWFMNPHIFYNDRLLEHYQNVEKIKSILPIKIRFFKRK